MKAFFHASRLCAGCESHYFHFAQCILFPEKNTFSERSRLKAEKSYEWFSYCFDRYRCTWHWLPLLRTLACKKMGNRPKCKTPAYTHEDGEDYVPSSKFTVFSHQFSSIAGAGPVTGPILASVFGWVPVLLWLIIGGLFFGAVQDFGALYASVKNEGKSMG